VIDVRGEMAKRLVSMCALTSASAVQKYRGIVQLVLRINSELYGRLFYSFREIIRKANRIKYYFCLFEKKRV